MMYVGDGRAEGVHTSALPDATHGADPMDSAVTDYDPADRVIQLAAQVTTAHAVHAELCREIPAGDPSIEAELAGYYAALEELAATPANTPAGIEAKARALKTCFVGGSVEGDCGLALSLVTDITRGTAG